MFCCAYCPVPFRTSGRASVLASVLASVRASIRTSWPAHVAEGARRRARGGGRGCAPKYRSISPHIRTLARPTVRLPVRPYGHQNGRSHMPLPWPFPLPRPCRCALSKRPFSVPRRVRPCCQAWSRPSQVPSSPELPMASPAPASPMPPTPELVLPACRQLRRPVRPCHRPCHQAPRCHHPP